MKKYLKPALLMVELRAEERLSVCDFDGSCDDDGFTDRNNNGFDDLLTLS